MEKEMEEERRFVLTSLRRESSMALCFSRQTGFEPKAHQLLALK